MSNEQPSLEEINQKLRDIANDRLAAALDWTRPFTLEERQRMISIAVDAGLLAEMPRDQWQALMDAEEAGE